MKLIVNGRNIALTDAIKGYINEKLNRIDEHYDFLKELHVFLSVEKNPRINESHKAEATIHVNGGIIRVSVSSEHLYASIDLLADKIDRALRKHKTKLLHRSKSGKHGSNESIRHINDLEHSLAELEPEEGEEFFVDMDLVDDIEEAPEKLASEA